MRVIDLYKHKESLGRLCFIGLLFWLVLAGVYRAYFVWLTPMREEVSLLHYMAWLVDVQRYVPYRDVFETAFPGSLFFHILIGKILGYGDTAFHIFDWMWLLILLIVTWRILLCFGYRVAYGAAAAFFALYFAQGAATTLQRDYVGILPIMLSLLLTIQNNPGLLWRSASVGFLMAIAAWMKPHLLVALPAIVWLGWSIATEADESKKNLWIGVLLCGFAGFSLFSGFILLWLWKTGGLSSFFYMVNNYLPIYMQDDGIAAWGMPLIHRIDLPEFVRGYMLKGGYGNLLILERLLWQMANGILHLLGAAVAFAPLALAGVARGFFLTVQGTLQRKLVIALLILWLSFWIYPAIANKYWNYHWMPFRYFSVLCFCLLLLPDGRKKISARIWSVLSFVGFVWLIQSVLPPPVGATTSEVLAEWREKGFRSENHREDSLAEYLKEYLQIGDTVQPLDEGGPAMRAMLKAGAIQATPYLTYRQLLVNADQPIVQRMRLDFISRLQRKPPRFIINTHTAPIEDNSGNLYKFAALDVLLATQYHKVFEQCTPHQCFITLWELNAS